MIRGDAEIEGRFGGVVDDGGPVFLGQGEDAEDATNAARALMLVDVIADGADRGAGMVRGAQDGQRFRRRAGRTIGVLDAMPAARAPAHAPAAAARSSD